MTAQKSILFVCLGNICRSPIAEACMKQLLEERTLIQDWLVDSAAIAHYNIGALPDERGQACMKKHHIYQHVEKHRARKITHNDYETFDYIFGMDKANMRDLERMAPSHEHKAQLLMLGTFDDNQSFGGIIEDPYYGNDDNDFEVVYQQCMRSCANFLETKSVCNK